MSAPPPSQLDASQVLTHSYDDATGAIRVNADVVANISGAQEVIISAVDDSIKIGNGLGNFVGITSGALDVNLKTSTITLPVSGAVSVSNASGSAAVNIQDGGNSLTVDGSVSVTGTVTSNIGTTNGLALDSTLSTINTTLANPFQAGGSIGNTTFTVTQTTGTNLHVVVDSAPTTAVTVASLPLPSGASIETKQDTGNTSLASIDGKLTTTNSDLFIINIIFGSFF